MLYVRTPTAYCRQLCTCISWGWEMVTMWTGTVAGRVDPKVWLKWSQCRQQLYLHSAGVASFTGVTKTEPANKIATWATKAWLAGYAVKKRQVLRHAMRTIPDVCAADTTVHKVAYDTHARKYSHAAGHVTHLHTYTSKRPFKATLYKHSAV